ncbi:MAG: hypothetical protein RLZZ440_1143 [Planctomycetota bacterium]
MTACMLRLPLRLLSGCGETILFLLVALWVTAPAVATALEHEPLQVEAPFEMPPLLVPIFPDRDFPITDFGGRAGEDATAAIARSIAACHAAGGGRVVIPRGVWPTGAVHLASHVNLHLAEGAVLRFSDDPDRYLPAVQSSWEGMECFNYSPLVYAFDCDDVALTGPGMLEAEMGTWKAWSGRPPAHLEASKRLYAMASTDVPIAERQMAEGEAHLRPQFVQFNRCTNVLIEGVKIRRSPFWTIHLLLCESVVVRGVDIQAHGHNNDGIDPEMTRGLLVEDCIFDQGDDAIAIKAGRNRDGWRLGVPTENVVIRNCTVRRGHQLVAIGSELSAGIRNVYVHDCRFERGEPFNLVFIKTNRRRGGFVENIHIERIAAARTRTALLSIETDVLYQWRDLVPTYEERLTRIEGIHLSDIELDETDTPVRILGDPDCPVQNVTLENLHVHRARHPASRLDHVEGLVERNVRVGE